MRYAIITPDVRDGIIAYKATHRRLLDERKIDYEPVEIRDNLFILPESVLNDIKFSELDIKGELDRRSGRSIDIREIAENEKNN